MKAGVESWIIDTKLTVDFTEGGKMQEPRLQMAFVVDDPSYLDRHGCRNFRVEWHQTDGSFVVEVYIPDRFVADLALKAIRNKSGKARQSVTNGTIHQEGFASAEAEVLARGKQAATVDFAATTMPSG